MDDDALASRIEGIVEPVVRGHGLELVEVEWRGHSPRGVLRVFVDKPGGVGIGECERVSRELGDVMDAAALMTTAYDLEVSSPGLDRQLRTDREFRWARGRRLWCWLAGGQSVRGRLADVTGEHLVVETEAGTVALERARVTKARLDPEVRWSRRTGT